MDGAAVCCLPQHPKPGGLNGGEREDGWREVVPREERGGGREGKRENKRNKKKEK